MRTYPKIDLKLRLALRVVALAACCFVGAAGYALVDANREAGTRVAQAGEIVARALALQHAQLAWINPAWGLFPDVPRVAAAFNTPGLCIAYRAGDGAVSQRTCNGLAPGDAPSPALFAWLYAAAFKPGREQVFALDHGNPGMGAAVLSLDRQSVIAQAWREISGKLALMAVMLLGLCLAVYAAIARALRPTRVIVAGLERLAARDLAARMPPFDLAELSRIGEVFNQLAGSLEETVAERNELTRRLIEVQDEERRHLARELHDEFGQCLAAMAAMAASAAQTAEEACPALLPECQTMQNVAARMMEALRGALVRLRPPDIDELGLAHSVEGLVAGWNRSGRGATRYELELCGGFDALPAGFAVNVYRIAQEALTNTAKHAEATHVRLRLAQLGAADRAESEIELVVEDNGRAGDADMGGKVGLGLLGMRERIAALGGRLSFEAAQPSGLVLRAVIPAPAA